MPDDAAPPPPDHSGPEPTGPDALAESLRRLAEAREYLVHLLAAEMDRIKLRMRRIAMWAIVGVVVIVVLLAILVASAGLLLTGIAHLIGQWIGGQFWLGLLITGGSVLLIGAIGVAFGLWSWQRSAFEAARERYSARKRRQRGQFGRDAESVEESQAE